MRTIRRDTAQVACHIRRVRTLADRRREQEKANADDRDLESRSDRRRQQDARENLLKGVATRLVNAKQGLLDRLGLEEALRAAVDTARIIRSAPARNRQINVVRQHLRGLGPALETLLAQLEGTVRPAAPAVPAAPRAPASPAVQAWCERLAESGDGALEELLRRHPEADRQQLRQRTRELSRARAEAPAPAVARAEARLRELLEPLAPSEPPPL